MIIDAQLHEPPVFLDWPTPHEADRYHLMTELQLAYLNAAGVDKAVLFPLDQAWGEYAVRQCPDRFALVPMVTADGLRGTKSAADADARSWVGVQKAVPGTVGIRILHSTSPLLHDDGEGGVRVHPIESFAPIVAGCLEHDLCLFMSTACALDGPAELARRHPGLRIVVDHLGLPQPPTFQRRSPPFADIERLLALADHGNIHVKLSGAPTLSLEPYPFADLWPHLERVVAAFGSERLMWGSDISRVQGRAGFRLDVASGQAPYSGRHSYAEALMFLRERTGLSGDDRTNILGRSASRLLGWGADPDDRCPDAHSDPRPASPSGRDAAAG